MAGEEVEGRLLAVRLKEEVFMEGVRAFELKEKKLNEREKYVDECYEAVTLREKEVDEGFRALESRERKVDEGFRELESREMEFDEGFRVLESRKKKVDEGFRALEYREKEFDERFRALELREKKVDEGFRALESREKKVDEGFRALESREKKLDVGFRALEYRDTEFDERFRALELREKEFDERFIALESREKDFDERFIALESRGKEIDESHREIALLKEEVDRCNLEVDRKDKEVNGKLRELKVQESVMFETQKRVELMEKKVDERFRAVEFRERELDECFLGLDLKQQQINERCENQGAKEKLISEMGQDLDELRQALEVKEMQIDERSQSLEEKEKHFSDAFELKEKQLSEGLEALGLKQKQLSESLKELGLKEKQFEESNREMELKKGAIHDHSKAVEEKERLIRSRETALDLREQQINQRCHDLETKEKLIIVQSRALNALQKQIDNNCLSLKLKEKQISEHSKAIELKEKQIEDIKAFELKERQVHEECRVLELNTKKGNEDKQSCEIYHPEVVPALSPRCKFPETEKGSSTEAQVGIGEPFRESFVVDDLQKLCGKMDIKGIRSYLIEHIKEYDMLGDKVLNSLHSASDPAKLVLEVIQSFHELELEKVSIQDVITSCIFLLIQFMKLRSHISSHVNDEARKFVDTWRLMLKQDKPSLENFSFLLFLASFNLVGYYDADEILLLFVTFFDDIEVYQPEKNPLLCNALGLIKNIPDLIQSLISRNKQLLAVRHICALKMEDAFPVAPILEDHLANIQKKVKDIVEQGSGTAQDNTVNMELTALKEVVECISECKLESSYSPVALKLQIQQLELKLPEISSFQGRNKQLGKELKERNTDPHPLEIKRYSNMKREGEKEIVETSNHQTLPSDAQSGKKRQPNSEVSLHEKRQRVVALVGGRDVQALSSSSLSIEQSSRPYQCHILPRQTSSAVRWPGYHLGASGPRYGVPHNQQTGLFGCWPGYHLGASGPRYSVPHYQQAGLFGVRAINPFDTPTYAYNARRQAFMMEQDNKFGNRRYNNFWC